MNIETLQEICKSLKAVSEDIKWETHLCFTVGGKVFLITSPDEVPVSASFKTSDERFEELIEKQGFKPSPYLARYKWVYLDDINRLSPKDWQIFIREAYRLVAEKLPKKLQKDIGL
ncbi:MAG TPA: MmcQ/YjbR family DNA-binding protein [Flavisolibacter sp.]|nr:MmcQ/YjbR family DNA-binding protein [Flavisolibacter sp.]